MPWLTVSRRVILPILLAAAVRAQCPNSIVAGPPSTYAGDGQQATAAWLFQPQSLSLDAAGNLYIADSGNNRIRKVTTDGVMHTVAGPDGLNNPQFVLAAPDGSVYIADTGNNQIRQLTTAGVVNVVAGTGHPGFSGDNGAAAAAEVSGPTGMALDSKGNLYFADSYNGTVRRIDTKGVITTVAGSGSASNPRGDGGLATYAGLDFPQGIAVAADGSIFIGDPGNGDIRRVAPNGTISTFGQFYVLATNLTLLPDGSLLFARGDLFHLSADGSTLSYYARAQAASSVVVGPSGIYYTSTENVVYRAASTASEPAIFAGQHYYGDAPDNVSAFGPIFGSSGAMVVGPDGSIWVADTADAKIRKILPTGTEKVVETGIGANQLTLDSAGNLYAAGPANVWTIAADGTSRLLAGGGDAPIPPLGAPAMPATSVDLSAVVGVVADSAGNVYVLSIGLNSVGYALITRITPGGQLTTIWDSTTMPSTAEESFVAEGFAIDAQGYLIVPEGQQIFRIATDGSGIFQTLPTPGDVESIATAPSGEIFYMSATGRIKALKAGGTLYNRDIYPTATYYPGVSYVGASTMIGVIFTAQPPGEIPVTYVRASPLATDAQGNLYAFDATIDAIRRFPVGSCFTARAPQLSLDTLPSAITPQPPNGTTTSSTTGTSYPGTPAQTYYFAPGELMSLYGAGLGPQTGVNATAGSNGLIATQLAGTRVLFQGVPAPVLYTSDGRVNAVIPFTLYGYPQLLVQVEYNGVLSDVVPLTMSEAAPIVFTSSDSGQPVAIVINQDGSINSQSNPASPGSIITFYGSGFGRTTPEGIDGHLATAPLPQPVLPVSAYVDDEPAAVLYAGDVMGMVEGVVQMNIKLPKDVYYGDVEIALGDLGMSFYVNVAGTYTTAR
jgi:uncharacterized protein (TIGR03437 family)